MSERRIQPITRIRGELQPASAVIDAVNRFLERPMGEKIAKMYTTAQVIVPQGEHRTRHALELAKMERELTARSLAQRAFVLARPLRLQEFSDGSGRLFFNVDGKNQRHLEWFGDRLGKVESLELPDESDMVYMEIARGGLARNSQRRREQIIAGREAMMADLDASSAQYRMTASGLHVVTKDMLYAVTEAMPSIDA